MVRRVYICSTKRTPVAVGKKKGALSHIHPVNLLATVLKEVARDIDAKHIEDVICGCVTPVRQQGANIPRLALLKAGYPIDVPGVQLNRMCGSSQQAVHFAAQAIASGDIECAVACGIEMMSVVKMGSDCEGPIFALNPYEEQKLPFGKFPFKLLHQGVSAELLAKKYGISKDDCDAFAKRSHELMHKATQEGRFKEEIIPMKTFKKDKQGKKLEGTDYTLDKDEGIRYPVNVESLKKLKTIFNPKGGIVTAGNASQISDGASAVLLVSEEKMKELGLEPIVEVVTRVSVGSDPVIMLDGVIPATKKLLKKSGLTVKDVDLFEVNEAFACVPLALQKTLSIPDEKFNVMGGAIAHGHPLGATGAFLVGKLAQEMKRSQKKLGVVTMCIGSGQSTATLLALPPKNKQQGKKIKSKL